jgi:hypothetical protein
LAPSGFPVFYTNLFALLIILSRVIRLLTETRLHSAKYTLTVFIGSPMPEAEGANKVATGYDGDAEKRIEEVKA